MFNYNTKYMSSLKQKLSTIDNQSNNQNTDNKRINKQMNEQLFIKDKINRMFLKITQTIDSFLKYLADIYRDNGVNYPIMHLQDVITRILTPYELLTQHRIVDNSDLIIKETFLPDFLGKYDSKPIINQKPNFVPQREINPSNFSQPLPSSLSAATPKIPLSSFQNQHSFPLKPSLASMIQLPIQPARRGGRPRALSPQLQHQLAKWIVYTASSGKQITRKDVTDLACQLLNDQSFQGSDGWFSNFLRRHPQIKKLIIRKRKNGVIVSNQVQRLIAGPIIGNQNLSKNADFYPMQSKRISQYRPAKYYLPSNRTTPKPQKDNSFPHLKIYEQQNLDESDQQQQKQSYLKYKDEQSQNKQPSSDSNLDNSVNNNSNSNNNNIDGDAFGNTEDNQQSIIQSLQDTHNNNNINNINNIINEGGQNNKKDQNKQ